MGYNTDFDGSFTFDRALELKHFEYLQKFSETRRMRRNSQTTSRLPDPTRKAAGLPVGAEGAYFVGAKGFAGQNRDDSIIDYNEPPVGQPGLWCKWIPSDDDGESVLVWNGLEKFYYYVEWLEYLIEHFIGPWGYVLNGEVEYQGEDPSDFGKIVVKDNVVKTLNGRKVYEEEEETEEAE